MKRLLMQSDDFGITDAACEGAIKGITEGIIRNTGIFINMENTIRSAKKAKNLDVCLGIDINCVAGRPVSDQKDVAHLIDENGMFITSKQIIQNHKVKAAKGLIIEFEEDPYPYEEVLLETENQVKRFIELIGRKPGYLHGHSLCTPNLYKAMQATARKYDIIFSMDVLNNKDYHYPMAVDFLNKNKTLEDQLSLDKKESFIHDFLPSIKDGETWIYITHCGYLDYDLFERSSLTLERMMDLNMVTDKSIVKYIEDNQILLITYQDLK